MRIAICDDDKDQLLRISSVLDSYRQARKAPIFYKAFQNATDLLAVAQDSDFSLYLLDIMMPVTNGMEAAREIRGFDAQVPLIFLTSSPEFAFQSYSVKAYDYLLKPVNEEKLFSILDHLLTPQPQACIYLKSQSGIVRMMYSNLAFVEINNKHLYFHQADGKVQEITAPLAAFEDVLLSRPEFIRVHRSYIVNLWQMARLSSSGLVTFAGESIPVSQLLYSKVKEAYVEQSFCKEAE